MLFGAKELPSIPTSVSGHFPPLQKGISFIPTCEIPFSILNLVQFPQTNRSPFSILFEQGKSEVTMMLRKVK